MIADHQSRTQIRRCEQDDLARIAWLKREAFRTPLDAEHWTSRGHVATTDGIVQAAVRAGTSGQYFGGRHVPIGFIDTLMVAPETRGGGVGTMLMVELLNEFHARGLPLVTNYATTIPFYQRLGWEIAGCRTVYRAPRQQAPRSDPPGLSTWDSADLAEVTDCYARFALGNSGLLARSDDWWREWVLYEPQDGKPLFRYMVRGDDSVTGYVIYEQAAEPSLLGSYSIDCREFVWTDRASLDALMNFVWAQGSLLNELSWPGPADDPLLMRFDQSRVRVTWPYTWLVRITNPVQAFESRGYPPGTNGRFEIRIVDPILPGGTTNVRVEVADGRAQAQNVSHAGMTVDVGALGAMYTGWLSARALARLGRLEHSTPHELEILESAFAGPKPWIIETF